MSADDDLLDRFAGACNRLDSDNRITPQRKVSFRGDFEKAVLSRTGMSPPPLFAALVRRFQWARIELPMMRIFANDDGDLVDGPLIDQMFDNRAMNDLLIPAGLLRFGLAPDIWYDAVCFDTRRIDGNGDCPIARVEHESIFCNGVIGERWDLFPTFRQFVNTIADSVHPE